MKKDHGITGLGRIKAPSGAAVAEESMLATDATDEELRIVAEVYAKLPESLRAITIFGGLVALRDAARAPVPENVAIPCARCGGDVTTEKPPEGTAPLAICINCRDKIESSDQLGRPGPRPGGETSLDQTPIEPGEFGPVIELKRQSTAGPVSGELTDAPTAALGGPLQQLRGAMEYFKTLPEVTTDQLGMCDYVIGLIDSGIGVLGQGDEERLREVLVAAEEWARSYGPWDSGNPDHSAGGDPEGVLYNALVRWARDGRPGLTDWRSEIVKRLVPDVEHRNLLVCIPCGGEGLGGASVVHFKACPLAQLMEEWGWEPIYDDDPTYQATCRMKLCTEGHHFEEHE